MQKITPFLWFNDNAEEAMNFYVSIFPNSKVVNVSRYGDAGPGPKGTVMSATFQLEGQHPKKANAVMNAMLQMKKIEIKRLQQAYDAA